MKMKNGDIVYGIITNIVSYGAFVSVDDYIGLIHISELSDGYVKDIHEYIKIGEKVRLKVIEVDEEQKKLKLSFKALNKVRGVKGDIPKYTIGFKSLRDRMASFIQEQKKEMSEEDAIQDN